MWIAKRKLNLAVQQVALQRHFPLSTATIRRSELTWEGDLLPSPLSDTYRIRIRYKLGKAPKVEVVWPALQLREGERCEHMYDEIEPCLYLPRANEWNEGMTLVTTIVPWTAEWLIHYEIWLATGVWCGGGIHPQGTDAKRLN